MEILQKIIKKPDEFSTNEPFLYVTLFYPFTQTYLLSSAYIVFDVSSLGSNRQNFFLFSIPNISVVFF